MAWRASRIGIVLGLVGGFLLDFLLPVQGAWLAALVAAGSGLGSLLAIAVAGMRPLPDPRMDIAAALEKVGAAHQVAHGLARASLVLASFALGLWAGKLVGIDPF